MFDDVVGIIVEVVGVDIEGLSLCGSEEVLALRELLCSMFVSSPSLFGTKLIFHQKEVLNQSRPQVISLFGSS
jgi:hypothetical protein